MSSSADDKGAAPVNVPLSNRARDWAFRLLYSSAVSGHDPLRLTDNVRQVLVTSDADWAAASTVSPYVEDPRAGRVSEEVWARIEDDVQRALGGVFEHRGQLEAAITAASKRWRLDRMPLVDRSLLLLGAFELIIVRARPARRVINRTVELAKRYGEENTPRFVNGILDQIRKNHDLSRD